MYRVIHLIDTYESPSLTRRIAAKARTWFEAYAIEVRFRRDEHQLRDADARMLEDVGLTPGAIARGALRPRREG